MKLLSRPIIQDWRDDNYKKLAWNSNKYLSIALEEGLLDGQRIMKQGVIADGDSAIVYYIETTEGRYIVKFSPSKGDLLPLKPFFDAWAEQRVRTPAIYYIREADDVIPYELALMEFIDAPTLPQAYAKKEIFRNGYYKILGATLANMHKVKGDGYGWLKNPAFLVGEYSSLSEELDYDIKQKRLAQLITQNHINASVERSYEHARDILEANMAGKRPSLCHNDFLPYNIFATDPITVFDANPSISSPLTDLGSAVGKILLKDAVYARDAANQMVSSYAHTFGELDFQALNAAIYISYISWIPRALASGAQDKAQRLINLVERGVVDYLR